MLDDLDEDTYIFIALMVGLISLAMSLIRLEMTWSLISVIYILLMVGLSTTSGDIERRWDIIKFITIPLLLGSSGLNFFVDDFILFLSIIPILSFIIILNLLQHTDFRAEFEFESNLIISFTISTGAFIAIGEFFSDRYLGTSFLMGNDYMMGDLFFFTLFAIMEGLLFKNYIMKLEYNRIERFKFRMENETRKRKKQFLEVLGKSYKKDERDLKLLTSKILQVGILVITVYGIITFDVRVFLLSSAGLAFTMIPYIYYYNMEGKVPSFFTLLISMSLFFYLLGAATNFYAHFYLPYFWWNRLIHFIGGVVLSFLIYIYLYYKNQAMEELYIPVWIIPMIIVTFLMTITVLFELFEFIIDILFRVGLQDNLSDTIYDMISNMMGAMFSIVLTHGYYRSYLFGESFDGKSLKKESKTDMFLNKLK